jgi:two-component system NtrC family sensor kinase
MPTPPSLGDDRGRARIPRTAVRLVAAFACVLALFGGALAVTLDTLDRIAQAEGELSRLEEAKHACHLATAALRGQYIEQTRIALAGAQASEPAYEAAVAEARHTSEVLLAALSSDPRRALAERIDRLSRDLDGRFRALLARSAPQARWAALEAEALPILVQAVALHDELHVELSRERNRAFDHAEALRSRARRVEIAFFVSAIVAAAAVAYLLGRSILRPVARLAAGATRMAGGDLSARIDLDGSDEFAALGDTLNRMATDLARHQEELIRSQRLAAVGQIAAGVAHEINNPLGVILGYLKLIKKEIASGTAAPAGLEAELTIVEDEARQCQRIVEGLLDLARPARLEAQPVDLAALAAEVLERIGETGKLEGLAVEPPRATAGAGGDATEVEGDERKLRQVVGNLVHNAAEATARGGTIAIEVSPERDGVTLVVADGGPGVPEHDRARVFDPFFSTKPRGTGLGLAVSLAIVEAHGGTIRLEPGRERGTRAVVWLPRRPPAATTGRSSPGPPRIAP